MDVLHVDCSTCSHRRRHCDDCVMSVLLAPPGASVDLDDEEVAALDALAAGGMVPPLRLVVVEEPRRRATG